MCCAVLSCSVMSDSWQPHIPWPAWLLCPWGFSRQEYWRGLPCPPPGDLPKPEIEPMSPALQVDSLSSEPLWKPMNTGVGSLSLLQGIFPTQKLNWSLLHCRRILYQLSYQCILNSMIISFISKFLVAFFCSCLSFTIGLAIFDDLLFLSMFMVLKSICYFFK